MNLETLFEKVKNSERIKSSRLAHVRMSVKHYAAALGCPRTKDCFQEVYNRDSATRNRLIEEYFDGKKSAYLVRNTKNDISFLLRLAGELNLILPQESASKNRVGGKNKLGRSLPRKTSAENTGFHRRSYGLPIARWSAKLREQYNDWKNWVSVERTIAGKIKPYNRPATIENKTDKMEAYFGYLYNIRRITDLDFRMLIDIEAPDLYGAGITNFVSMRKEPNKGLLEEFTEWHRKRNTGKASSQAKALLSVAVGLAEKYYLPKAILADHSFEIESYNKISFAINELQRKLTVEINSGKKEVNRDIRLVSADDIRFAARQEFPLTTLFDNQSGTVLALNAGRALALLMLVNYPLRNKNYREARLSHNILKNADGKWILHFTGDEEPAGLKSKQRLQVKNVYEKIIESEAAEFLDKYLNEWHPLLVQQIENKISDLTKTESASSEKQISLLIKYKKYLFLNSRGVPFSRQGFSKWIEKGLYRWLGVRITPEDIRQIAAIDMLNENKSVSEVAELLNDVPESILRIRSDYS